MSKEEILGIIIENVCDVIPELEGYEFKNEDQLVDLGANSIDRTEIVNLTLERLALTIPRVELSVAGNIGELAEVIYEKMRSN